MSNTNNQELKFNYIYKNKDNESIIKMPLELSWDFKSIQNFFSAINTLKQYKLIAKCQYIGRNDKNKVQIYTNDIVRVNNKLYKVWSSGVAFGLIDMEDNFYEYICNLSDMNGKVYEVVGNIFDTHLIEKIKQGEIK